MNDNNDKVEITLKGSATAIGDILTGNVTRALEDKMDVQRELDRTREDRDTIQSKLWKAEDAVAAAERRVVATQGESDRLLRLVREGNDTIRAHERTINDLHDKIRDLENKAAVELTPDMLTKLAEARENVFQNLMADVTFPDNKPKPQTLAELFSFFVFPIFEAGRAPAGWSPGQPVGGSSGVTNKIAMIKQLHKQTGARLKDAKDFIEGFSANLKMPDLPPIG